jgi:hypothetical protein
MTASRARAWLDGPLSAWWCVLGWCVATAVFLGCIALLGGFTGYDTFESVLSTWAIQHGQFACAFPQGFREIAPLYPLLSGGIAAATHIGHTVPFPPRAVMGPHCDKAFVVINTWSLQSKALNDTFKIAYVSWPILMAGVIALLRATGRGRTGWEPATLIVVACLPPVWSCVQTTFHPEDLIAVGFALGAVACALRGSWLAAGILIGLGFLSQQPALLVGAPLLILAPAPRRIAYATAAAVTIAVVALPLTLTNTSAAHAILFGTGNNGGIGGTILWEPGIRGTALLFLSRILPVALSMALAWWVVRRTSPGSLDPAVVVALIAVSLGLRLVFEQQLYEYYFMALAVALVLLDVVRGHIRGSLVAWLVIVPTVFLEDINVPTWAFDVVPLSAIVLGLVLITSGLARGRARGQLMPWLGVVLLALIAWHKTEVIGVPHTWLWQLIVVTPGVVLAARPLLDEVRHRRPLPLLQTAENLLPAPQYS